jgi:hypothetical protein
MRYSLMMKHADQEVGMTSLLSTNYALHVQHACMQENRTFLEKYN